MCSVVIICAIFYIFGLHDFINHLSSQIIIYCFDGCVIMYFIAFPLICILFHPDMRRKKK